MCNDSIVPNYLKNIAYEVIQKKEKVSFKTECTCGCRLFDFYKKKKSNEDKLKETTLKTLDKKYNGKFYSDSDGNLWLCSKSFLGINRKKIKITKQELKSLYSYMRAIIKICCVNCGKEYIIFDSSEYGYDGVVDFLENPLVADRSKIDYKNVISSAECAIEIRNTCPYSEFEEEFGKDGNYAMYTNAYSDIKIMAITAEKKKTIFSAETQ